MPAIVINTVNELKTISRKRPKEVRLNLAYLDVSDNEAWTNRYNTLLNECGCSSGRQFITYTAPFYIILIVFLALFTPLSRPVIIGIFVVAVIITGIAGKVTGLKQRNRLLNELTDEFLAKTGLS